MAEGTQPWLFDHPGNSKSIVWKYFGFIKTQDGPANKSTLDMTKAVCKLCRKTYQNKGKHTFWHVSKLIEFGPIIIENRIGKLYRLFRLIDYEFQTDSQHYAGLCGKVFQYSRNVIKSWKLLLFTKPTIFNEREKLVGCILTRGSREPVIAHLV